MEKKIKLNKEQLQQVKDHLKNKEIKYIDLQFEILDHMASDIEVKMETLKIDFETSFEEVKEKWSENFSRTFSFLLGPIYLRPSIFIDRCKKIYKPHYKIGNRLMIIYVVVFAILKYLFFKDSELAVKFLNYFLVSSSFVYVWVISYWFFLIKKTKQKTTFSFLFNTQVAPTILVLILVVANIINESFLEFGTFYTIFIYILFMTFYQGHNFYKNHNKVVSNFKSIS